MYASGARIPHGGDFAEAGGIMPDADISLRPCNAVISSEVTAKNARFRASAVTTVSARRHAMIVPLIIFLGVLLVVLFQLFFSGMIVNIGGQQVGIRERKYFGRALPEGRVVAMGGEIGIQAGVLQPGLKFQTPFLWKVTKDDMLVVAEDEVGLVESIDGQPLEPGRIFARWVAGHDSFQDGESFLRSGGQKGPQVDILPPGKYRINTYLFRVRVESAVVIAQGQVGIVSARDGTPLVTGRRWRTRWRDTRRSRTAKRSSPTAASAARRSK
jgi:hypothetical protein